MKIEAGGNYSFLDIIFPIIINNILSIGYSNINEGENWSYASFCLSNLASESFKYMVYINESDFFNKGSYIEKTVSVFLIGI